MSDPTTATQDAFFAALDVPAVTVIAPVLQHVPEGTNPPLIIVGNITLEPLGGKGGGLDRATVEVVTLYRGPKRAGLFALQALVRNALDNKPIAADGMTFEAPVQTSSDSDLLDDGLTYVGTQRFETIVQ